jgi:LIVCS family branched-chain amino acid:cation transporter
MRFTQTLTLAFSVFALFVGAGNVIFPPEVGIAAGPDFVPALLGFIATAVGLPIAGLVIMSHAGNLDALLAKTPRWASFVVVLFIYLIIGPLFATPRTSLVSYELGIAPLLGADAGNFLYLYVPIFFIAAAIFAILATHLTDAIGNFITPILILLLVAFSYFVFTAPANPVDNQLVSHIEGNAFLYGFIQGYKTLDGIVSIIFGVIVLAALKDHGVKEQGARVSNTVKAGLIAGGCMAFLYMSLMYLGASNQSVMAMDANGPAIIGAFIDRELGTTGQYVVSLIIFLACFSTVVGLLSACAQFFKNTFGMVGYNGWVLIMAGTSSLLAFRGLDKVIEFAVPLLSIAYPAFMALMILYCINSKLVQAKQANLISFVSVVAYCIVEFSVSHGAFTLDALKSLPLADQGFGWLSIFLVALAGHQVGAYAFGGRLQKAQTV